MNGMHCMDFIFSNILNFSWKWDFCNKFLSNNYFIQSKHVHAIITEIMNEALLYKH